jgi:hypothetical protein
MQGNTIARTGVKSTVMPLRGSGSSSAPPTRVPAGGLRPRSSGREITGIPLPAALVFFALAADYLSPPARWTVVFPLAATALLLGRRKWRAAVMVAALSSWILIPAVAAAVCAVNAVRGTPRLYVTQLAGLIGVDERDYEPCHSRSLRLVNLAIAGDPTRPIVGLPTRIKLSFAATQNWMALGLARRHEGDLCGPPGRAEWVVLPPAEAQRLRRQCSRGFPEGLSDPWTPSPQDVERAEAALPSALDAAWARLDGTRRPAHYHRQYTGFVRSGKRVLYLNALAHGEFFYAELGDEWRRRAVVVCDGGTDYLGAVFDLERGAFDSLEFNGAI